MADRDAFDLFAGLGSLNRRDLQWYDSLADEGKKAAHPLVIMRWLSGTSDRAQIVRLNEFANKYIFSLGTEKALLFKLLASSCTGSKRVTWLKGPSTSSTRLAVKAVQDMYEVSAREAEQYLGLLDSEDVLHCAEHAGWDADAIKKLKAELAKDRDGSGAAPKSSARKKKPA
jgi:hypothetical protein